MDKITKELEQAVALHKERERHDSLMASAFKIREALSLLDRSAEDFLNAGIAEEFPHLWQEIRKAQSESARCADWARRETLKLAQGFRLKTGGEA